MVNPPPRIIIRELSTYFKPIRQKKCDKGKVSLRSTRSIKTGASDSDRRARAKLVSRACLLSRAFVYSLARVSALSRVRLLSRPCVCSLARVSALSRVCLLSRACFFSLARVSALSRVFLLSRACVCSLARVSSLSRASYSRSRRSPSTQARTRYVLY